MNCSVKLAVPGDLALTGYWKTPGGFFLLAAGKKNTIRVLSVKNIHKKSIQIADLYNHLTENVF